MNEKGIVRNQRVSSLKINLSREFRRNMTSAETEFWEMVRGKRMFGLKFRRQQIIDGFIVDFYCDKIGLCIEIDGGVHDNPEQRAYDQLRDKAISLRGIKILRFTNDDVLNNKDIVIKTIKNLTSPPPPARPSPGKRGAS